MLYSVNCELKAGYPLPPEEWLEIVVNGMEDIVRYKEQGKVLFHGEPVGRQAGTMIWNVDSHQELQGLLCRLPFWPFMEWEVTPLISTEEALESVKQALASVRE